MLDEEIAAKCVEIAITALRYGEKAKEEEYSYLLSPAAQRRHKSAANKTRRIDMVVQKVVEGMLEAEFPDILILGEEVARYPKTLSDAKNEYVCVLDPVDGTDLLARGFGNWCCSMAILSPKQRRICAAVVGHSNGTVYYATPQVAKKRVGQHDHALRVDRRRAFSIADASVCFYGQKLKRLAEVMADARFKNLMRPNVQNSTRFRIYNLAGNPMMVKIPDGSVDVVFDLSGQEVHDFIPGAFIATRAGAVLRDLSNRPIDLDEQALRPRERVSYVLSATEGLGTEFLTIATTAATATA